MILNTPFPGLSTTPYIPDIGGQAGIKVASVNEPTKDLILVHTVELKPMIIEQISGSMVSSGIISDVAFALVYSEKTCLKKLMKIIK